MNPARVSIVMLSTVGTVILAGCTWGPPFQMVPVATWAEDGSAVVIPTSESLIAFNCSGEQIACWTASELADPSGASLQFFGIMPPLVWESDSALMMVAVDRNPADGIAPIAVTRFSRSGTGRWEQATTRFDLAGDDDAGITRITTLGLAADGRLTMVAVWQGAFPNVIENGVWGYLPSHFLTDVMVTLDTRNGSFALTPCSTLDTSPVYDPAERCWWWLERAQGEGTLLLRASHDRLDDHTIDSQTVMRLALPPVDTSAIDLQPIDNGRVLLKVPESECVDERPQSLTLRRYIVDHTRSEVTLDHVSRLELGSTSAGHVAVNPSGTIAAWFGAKGQLEFRHLDTGEAHTVHFPRPHRLHTGWSDTPIDGRSMIPRWLDDHSLFTLWPDEETAGHMDLVIWDTSKEQIRKRCVICRDATSVWPRALRIFVSYWGAMP